VLVATNGEVLAASERYFSRSNTWREAVKLRTVIQALLHEPPRRF
jgi:hypothetical protein